MEEPATGQREVWERIADSFDRSRNRTWTHVEGYLRDLPSDSLVLDLMCGNGRHSAVAKDLGHHVVSMDWSSGLVRKAQERYGTGVIGDATRLPFADDAFDACIYVAGWHGIPTADGRASSLAELHRVLKPGATAQITNWSRDAPRFKEKGTPGDAVDVVIPWRSDGLDEERTYHLTTLDGFRSLCEAAGFTVTDAADVAIVARPPDADNHVVVVKK